MVGGGRGAPRFNCFQFDPNSLARPSTGKVDFALVSAGQSGRVLGQQAEPPGPSVFITVLGLLVHKCTPCEFHLPPTDGPKSGKPRLSLDILNFDIQFSQSSSNWIPDFPDFKTNI